MDILGIEVNWFVVAVVVAFPIILGIIVFAGNPKHVRMAHEMAHEVLPEKAGDLDGGNERASIFSVAAAIVIIYVTYQWLA